MYLVEAQDWEKSVGELVKAVSSLATNRIAIARFKASYEAGSQAIKNAAQASSKSGPDNMDEPLPEATLKQVQRDFQARYNVTFDPALDPADALRARVYRQFRKGIGECHPYPKREVHPVQLSAQDTGDGAACNRASCGVREGELCRCVQCCAVLLWPAHTDERLGVGRMLHH